MKRRTGFTLIELLVVVAIIAVLISMLLPALNSARENAKKLICGNNLNQVSKAMFQYAQDFNDMIPPFTYALGSKPYVCSSYGPNMQESGLTLLVKRDMSPSTTNGDVLAKFCPENGYLMNADPFYCADDANPNGAAAYRVSPHWFAPNHKISYWYCFVDPMGHAYSQVKQTVPGYFDGWQRYNTTSAKSCKQEVSPTNAVILFDGSVATSMSGITTSFPMMHPDGWNALYMDGHVKGQKLNDVNYTVESKGLTTDGFNMIQVFDQKG